MSLLTSVLYGAADYAGGKATRLRSLLVVIAGAHLIGLIGVTALAFVLADGFGLRDFGIGALSGLAGLLALSLLYRRLAIGPMMIVAPITAIMSAALPAAWGIFRGDSVSALTLAGIALAFVSIGLVSLGDSSTEEGGGGDLTFAAIAESLLAGVGFGTMFILFSETNPDHAPWPVVGSRTVTVSLLIAVVLARWPREREALTGLGMGGRNSAAAIIVAAGLLDVGGNVTFLFATGVGSLTTVAVLSSLYPAVTILLAAAVDNERVRRVQGLGMVAALVATALITAG